MKQVSQSVSHMELYPVLKTIHISCVILTITLFFIRALPLIRSGKELDIVWLRIAPHVNDTILLLSALAMVYVADLHPFGAQLWLGGKIILLMLYISSGILFFRMAQTAFTRKILFTTAIILFILILLLAIFKP